jgi:hypothetical protein
MSVAFMNILGDVINPNNTDPQHAPDSTLTTACTMLSDV